MIAQVTPNTKIPVVLERKITQFQPNKEKPASIAPLEEIFIRLS